MSEADSRILAHSPAIRRATIDLLRRVLEELLARTGRGGVSGACSASG